MKTGIIGLPQVGKTSLFKILTHAHLDQHAFHSREPHVGVAKVPDERLDKLAELVKPRKVTHASIEFVDAAAIPAHQTKPAAPSGHEALKEPAYAAALRQVDALAHVVRAFDDPAIPHVGEINPLRDISNVELDLMVSDLGQIEKRLEKLEKELKKVRSPELEKEHELLLKSKAQLERERPLRELELIPDDQKRLLGFMFLSQKPVLYVINVGETADLGSELERAVEKHNLAEVSSRPHVAVTAVCGKVEAELAEMDDAETAEFLASYNLKESGLVRLVRKTYELMGLISFFTTMGDECRAWTVPQGTHAIDAAGVIHSDLQKHFVRAEVIRWDALLAAGSDANARAHGTLRLEGKDYVVKDGDVVHVRHTA